MNLIILIIPTIINNATIIFTLIDPVFGIDSFAVVVSEVFCCSPAKFWFSFPGVCSLSIVTCVVLVEFVGFVFVSCVEFVLLFTSPVLSVSGFSVGSVLFSSSSVGSVVCGSSIFIVASLFVNSKSFVPSVNSSISKFTLVEHGSTPSANVNVIFAISVDAVGSFGSTTILCVSFAYVAVYPFNPSTFTSENIDVSYFNFSFISY